MGGPVLRSGRKWPFGPPHEPPASIRPRLPKKLEPCGWMPFSGLPDGPFRGGVVQRQNRGLFSSLFGRWWSSAFRRTTPIFVARGPALLFGISRWLSQHGISRKRRNNLTRVLIAVERSTQESKANSSHPSSREGHRCAGLSLRQFGVRRSDCRRHFPCPAELGSITPHAMHNHGEPSCQCDDGFFLPPTLWASPADPRPRPGSAGVSRYYGTFARRAGSCVESLPSCIARFSCSRATMKSVSG